ncbi:hypothetical protein [Leptolyngbya iicbica]|uniref:Uncharacterized protein n=2 Tax=Cyanophyceae TaxID=3028117 RepID=A0A4Q7E9P3_9CYAN|nr:hypothetical protein [Leptolyngbya sp. LK]RZM79342.1 hypothetical protein DYY88_11385 [Leptolyngbya sp. LK]
MKLISLNDNTVKFGPSTSEATLKNLGAASITFGNTTIYIGTFQESSNNQDPIVTSFTNGSRDWTQYYDTSGIDGRGVGLLWNGISQNLYGVFTADGGSQGANTFGQVTQGGWLSGYGSGGGAKVSVLLKLNPATGASEAGTFIRAQLANGNTNTLMPVDLDFVGNQVVFFGDSFFTPLDVNRQRFNNQNPAFNSPFDYRVVLSPDLSRATSAEAIGWNGVTAFGASGGQGANRYGGGLFLALSLSAQIGVAGFGHPVSTFGTVINGINIEHIFDEGYYLATNPDVATAVKAGQVESGYQHFLVAGLAEGRGPFQFYDEAFYLAQNADIASAVLSGALTSGLQHFLSFGHEEERDPSAAFDSSDYLLSNPDIKSAVDNGAIASAFEHFANFGLTEGRFSDVLLFDENYYLANNADVAQVVNAGLVNSGWEHFLTFGQTEKRDPSANFSQETYLSLHQDVAGAIANGGMPSAFYHYAAFGIAEGRAI